MDWVQVWTACVVILSVAALCWSKRPTGRLRVEPDRVFTVLVSLFFYAVPFGRVFGWW